LIRRTPVIDVAMEFSRCTRAYARPTESTRAFARSFKTQQRDVELQARSRKAAACHQQSRGRRCSRRTNYRTEIQKEIHTTGLAPTAMNWRYP